MSRPRVASADAGQGRSMSTRVSGDEVRATLWFAPSVAATAASVVTLGLLTVRPSSDAGWAAALWPGDAEAASTLLSVVATPP